MSTVTGQELQLSLSIRHLAWEDRALCAEVDAEAEHIGTQAGQLVRRAQAGIGGPQQPLGDWDYIQVSVERSF